MTQTSFGLHELLELHELLAAEDAVILKMQQSLDTVQDGDLKGYIRTAMAVFIVAEGARYRPSPGRRPGGRE